MSYRSALTILSLSLSTLYLSGCAGRETTPTLADEMRGAASEIQAQADRKDQLAADWERGQALITSGQRKIERGERRIQSAERDLERGRSELSEGQQELREGRRLVAESERQYDEIRPTRTENPSGQR